MGNFANMIVVLLRKVWGFLQSPPAWFKALCEAIGEIVFHLLKLAGKDIIALVEEEIIRVQQKYGNDEDSNSKFDRVWDFARKILPQSFQESEIDTLIQSIFIKLKKAGRV